MNDPLGLFDEEAPDPLGLFAESRPIAGAAETALSIGTGALAQIPAGLAGIGTAITERSLEKGGAKASQVMEDFTYQPKTATGQKYTENTMNVLNKPVEWLGDAGEAVAGNEGRLVGEILGNFAPDIALGGAGLAARARVKAKPKTSNPKLTALDEIAAAKVAAAETSPTMYGTPDGQVSVGPIPKIESDPSVVALAKQRAAQLEREAKGLSDTMYVGRDGDISGQLGTKIETDPSAVENLRIQQQQGLENVARQAELPSPEQLDMFQRADGEQMRIENTFGQDDPLGLFEPLDKAGPRAQAAAQLSDAQIRQLENKFEAVIDDKVVGSLEANLTPEQARQLGEDSSVNMVKVDPAHRGKGVGSDLYDAWNKAYGGKITPSGKTTAEAWRVWKRNYPEKVEGFVKQEAQRLRDGAPRSVVLENITDPDIRKQVLEASQIAVPKGQRGAFDINALTEGLAGIKRALKTNTNILKDDTGEAVIVFRGNNNPEKGAEARTNYSTFVSDNPYLSSTYARTDFGAAGGTVQPFTIKSDVKVIEFPVKQDGSFDKFAFDEQAKRLGKNEVLVARNSRDYGPGGDSDPFFRASDKNDQYAFKDSSVVKSLYENTKGLKPENRPSNFKESRIAHLTSLIEDVKAGRGQYKDFTDNGKKAEIARLERSVSGMKNSMVIPKGQRGGVNLSEIIGGFRSPNSKANSVKIEPTIGERLQSNIPGLKEVTKDYIPPDDPVASVLSAAKGESDSNIKHTWVKSGATLTAEAAKSSLIKGVGRYFQNATKRAERDIRTYVEPTEKMFRDLSRKDVTELSEVFKREMFADSKFSVEELQRAGFEPEQIDAYGAMRVMFDETLKKQNASRTALGMKPITGKEAYLSSRWQGDYRIPVYDQKGKLVWAIAERSERGAKKALEYIEKELGIKVDKEKSKLRYRKSNQKGELDDAYVTMLEMLDKDDPRIPAIKSAMEEAMSNDAFSTLGQAKHFERKANVRGFVGDRPWMQESKDAYDMFQQQFQYAKNGFQWSELQKASASAKEILNDPELQTAQPNNLNYVREYAKQNLGYGELPYIADMERAAAQLIGRDRSAFYNTIGNMKNFFLTTKLAMSLGYITASLLQPVMVGPWHARLSNQGFKHNPLTSFVGGMGDGSALFARHSGMPESITPITKIGAEALKYAEENGIVSRNLYDEAAGLGENRAMELLKNTAGVTISAPEKLSRSISFMSFVHHLKQSGAFKDNIKLFQKAEEMTNAAMVDYRRGERPMVFEKLGATGSALGTLQTFKFNYFNQLHTFAKFAKEGNPAPLMMFLGLQGMLGGAVSLPFLEDLDSMFQMVKGWLPADAYKKVAHFTPKKAIIENLPDAVAYGGVSKLTGANMSSRFDASNLADFSLDQTFPFITDLARQAGSVASFAANPNDTTAAQAAFDVTPPGLQGLVETNLDSFKGGKTDKGQVYYNPKKVKDADAKFVRTPEQELYRKFGLRELGEARESELGWRQAMNEKELAARLKSANVSFYDAVRRKDKADIAKYAKHYIDFGGDGNKLDSIIKQEVEKGNILPKDYLIIKAKALGSVQKAVRANEQLRTE